MEIEKRFWKKVNKTDNIKDCWEWLGSSRSKFGYGAIKFMNRVIDTHRFSWMLFNNVYNLTSKDYICHKCDNPKCVNPHHLFLGNAKVNAKDAYDKGRVIIPEGKRFEENHRPLNSALTENQAIEIKNLINYRKENNIRLNLRKIAEEFKVEYQTVRDISANRSYINL